MPATLHLESNSASEALTMSGSGLGGLNKSHPDSIIIGLGQSQLFDV